MATLADFKEDFVLLLEGGFVAISYMDEDAATKLFHAAALLDKASTAPQIGLAAVAMHKLDTKRSCKILEEIMEKEPENNRAAAMLGISYLLGSEKINEGEKLLQQALSDTEDPATKRLGELWLDVLEKGVRKSDSPVQPQKKK